MGIWVREIKKKNGSITRKWYGNYTRNTGRRYPSGKPIYKRETFSIGDANNMSRKRAEKRYAEIISEIEGNEGKTLSTKPTLPEFIPHYLSYCRDIIGKRSVARDEQSLKFLSSYFGPVKLSEITPAGCIRYQQHRKKEGRSNRTINIELACLRHLFNVAKLQGYANDNPVSKIRFLEVTLKKDRILNPEEEKRLITASPGYLRDIITAALQTGMRKAEITSLTWDNVDLKNNYIFVDYFRAKTKRMRKVPISRTLHELLIRLKKEHPDSKHVFLNSHKEPYEKASSMNLVFETAKKKAGLKNFRFHDLRHTTATRLVEAGASIFSVAKILGHQDVRMTAQRYAHPDQSLKDDIELLSGNIRNTVRNNSKGKKTR